jgi:hypothetical protein
MANDQRIVEQAIRRFVNASDTLYTTAQRRPFGIGSLTTAGLTIFIGKERAPQAVPWSLLESLPGKLRGSGWVLYGGKHSLDSDDGTLESWVKPALNRSTANYLAPLLEKAGLVETRKNPLALRLK